MTAPRPCAGGCGRTVAKRGATLCLRCWRALPEPRRRTAEKLRGRKLSEETKRRISAGMIRVGEARRREALARAEREIRKIVRRLREMRRPRRRRAAPRVTVDGGGPGRRE